MLYCGYNSEMYVWTREYVVYGVVILTDIFGNNAE
jgi:hypothetical protein